MRRAAVLTLAACAVALPVSAHGQVPAMMNHQGVLTTSGGAPLADGAHDLSFALYASSDGAAPLWSDTVADVAVRGGFYSVVLGASVPFPAGLFRDHAALWLGVRVDGGDELPRGRLLTVGYAFEADHAMLATAAATAQGLNCTGCIPDSALGFDLDAAVEAGATAACYDTPAELRAALDAIYAPLAHTHDGLYAPAGHDHDAAYEPAGAVAGHVLAVPHLAEAQAAALTGGPSSSADSWHTHPSLAAKDNFGGADGDLILASGTTTLDTSSGPLVKDYSRVSIAANAVLTKTQNGFPLIIRVSGDLTIEGTVDLKGKGWSGGASSGGVAGPTNGNPGTGGGYGDGGHQDANMTKGGAGTGLVGAPPAPVVACGAGGGASYTIGGGNPARRTGAGGTGGGAILFEVRGHVTVGSSGVIDARGNDGASPGCIDCGGGGGGGGGYVIIVHGGSFSNAGSILVAGGSTGTGTGGYQGGGGGSFKAGTSAGRGGDGLFAVFKWKQ